jgi:hypothetical protein
VTEWAVRAALAAGWLVLPIALGAAGAAVMGVVKLSAWVWGLPRQGRRRAKIRARQRARAQAAQYEARREFIEMMEREWPGPEPKREE